jgi:hypothetical protein
MSHSFNVNVIFATSFDHIIRSSSGTYELIYFIYFISLSINPVESIQTIADVEIVLVTVTIKNTVCHPIGYIFVIQI